MTYPIARARLVTILENIAGLPTPRGQQPTFKHDPEASDTKPPADVREFYIVASRDGDSGLRGPLTPDLAGQPLIETTVRITVAYPIDDDWQTFDEVIEGDRIAIQTSLGQPTKYQPDIAWIVGGDRAPLFRARRRAVPGVEYLDIIFTMTHR